jgi:hypothetical protein
LTGIGYGPAGRSCTFAPYWKRNGPDWSPLVIVSTEWTPEERDPELLPPGYQGTGVRFAPPAPGVL